MEGRDRVSCGSSPGQKCLFKVQDHAGWVLQVLPPKIGEATHGGAVDDAVIRRPADLHDVSSGHLTITVEPRQNLDGREAGSYSVRTNQLSFLD